MKKKENPFINLFANLLLPVFILNKTAWFPGENKAFAALIVALSFPLAYGLWDLYKNSKVNYFSILGLANTLITGVLALLHLGGIWFAIKEAAFPAVLGIGAYLTSLQKKPFFKDFITASGLLNMDRIQKEAEEKEKQKELQHSFILSNNLFALSFFLSAFLNFVLALYIFKPLSSDLNPEEKSVLLNTQISQMTWAGFLVISVPMVFFLMFTVFKLLKDLQKITGLEQEEIFSHPS